MTAFTPAPAAAPLLRMLLAQAAFETRLLLRNGEQVLLTLVIPLGLLAFLVAVPVVDTGDTAPVDFFVPGVLALAVMSTALTSLAIATGYERRYGVLKRLAVSPLPRWAVLVAKAGTVLVIEAVQVLLVGGLGLVLGWRPQGVAVVAILLVLLGTLAFAGIALLMAGTLRAEATLAVANLLFLVLLAVGGVVVPLDRFPDTVQPMLAATPTGALTEGLRAVLTDAAGVPWASLGILATWTVAGFAAAARWFRWE